MRVAFLDCFSGISGDMFIASLLDAGLSLSKLEGELKKLNLSFRLETEKVTRQGIAGLRFKVIPAEHAVIRTWPSIREIVSSSRLEKEVKEKTLKILKTIAEAEAKIHRVSLDQVHFHEIGGVDTIIDATGAALSLKLLKIKKVYCSPLPQGVGFVQTEHGLLPLPAPATSEILKGVPTYSRPISAELTTPTGAAIAKNLVDEFREIPPLKVEAIGYGAGSKELEQPNLLRVFIGQKVEEEEEEIKLIETTIDDSQPQSLGYLAELLIEKGALDVWLTPIQMKKNRPGVVLSVLVSAPFQEKILELIFSETNTLGVRFIPLKRLTLERKVVEVRTKLGKARVKIGFWKGKPVTISPEYEDCKKIAKEKNLTLKEVQDEFRLKAKKSLKKLF